MAFDWMQPSVPRRPAGAARVAMYRHELVDRAALLYRLGYSPEHATARLEANVAWDFEIGGRRPDALGPDAIEALVKATYARRPAGH